ncbi:MAG: 2-hydroxyacyl-CoA dehydratase [Clostridia bacterium]|nr:2-hydroxyacyl-CoA dehydratase [Clostridia bacterium]
MEYKINRIEYTEEMDKEYTILIPNMLDVHFSFIQNLLEQDGHKVVLLKNEGRAVVDAGLKYVHNDTCYPALLVIGQFIDALQSGEFDVNKVAVMITQTGGGCRASNYLHLLRKALAKAGFPQVPVISLNVAGLEKNSGFKLSLPLIRKAMAAVVYGDMLMLLRNQVRPYEINAGDAEKLREHYTQKLCDDFTQSKGFTKKEMQENLKEMVRTFSEIPMEKTPKIKVGIVGEIYVKYSSLANNNLEDFLHEQGCEVDVPGLLGFLTFYIGNKLEEIKLYGGNKIKEFILEQVRVYLTGIEKIMIDVINEDGTFTAPMPFRKVHALAAQAISYGCDMGEGWLLTAEMMELIEHGYKNIVCAQPFGCLPNHIVGKGMIRKIRELYPDSNIVPIDYDPGATKVNQENRIKLMLAVAKENMQKENK